MMRKKINGRKRHIISPILPGTSSRPCTTPAISKIRDGMLAVRLDRYLFLGLRHVFADGGYAGGKLAAALAGHGQWQIEIVKLVRSIRWISALATTLGVVERIFGGLDLRRGAKDF